MDITAVKLVNKKIYLQEGLSETWVIVQAFTRESACAFITDLGGKIADIVGGMDPRKSEGMRTAEILGEDYKLISESETEVSLREGSFGKLIRVKNENIFREPSKGNVFEEEGFETERTDDEEGFVTVLRRECPSKGRSPFRSDKKASGACPTNTDTLCEEVTKKSKLSACTDKRTSGTVGMDQGLDAPDQHFKMNIHETFFFNRKRRVPRNWKLERAVRLAETGTSGPYLRHVRIKKTLASGDKKMVHATEFTESSGVKESNSTLQTVESVPAVQNVLKESAVEEGALYAENPDRRHDDAVQKDTESQSALRKQSRSRSEPLKKHENNIVHEQGSCRTESADGDTEGDICSFDVVTISTPKLFSVFDVLFDRDSLSDELDV